MFLLKDYGIYQSLFYIRILGLNIASQDSLKVNVNTAEVFPQLHREDVGPSI